MAYNDADLINQIRGVGYNPNEAGSWARGAVNTLDSHLSQLSPQQLLERYAFIQGQNPSSVDSFSNQRYGVSTAKDKAYYSAYKTAQDTLGRSLTATEFAQIAPIFGNGSNEEVAAGRAYLAQMAQQQQYDPRSAQNQQKAGQFSGDINGIFNDLLSRGASQEEINHFGSLLSAGQLDPYTLRQFVQQLPEHQTAQDQKFRQGISKELEDYDTKAFQRQSGSVIGDYANRGIYNSPSLDYALTDLMEKVAEKRQSFLTGLSADQYQGNKANATQDYRTGLERMFSDQDYNRSRTNQLQDLYTQRSFDVNDYNRQSADYMNFMNQNKSKGSNPLYGAAGGLLGAGVGGFFGGPAGAGAGYQIGSGTGSYFDYLNR